MKLGGYPDVTQLSWCFLLNTFGCQPIPWGSDSLGLVSRHGRRESSFPGVVEYVGDFFAIQPGGRFMVESWPECVIELWRSAALSERLSANKKADPSRTAR